MLPFVAHRIRTVLWTAFYRFFGFAVFSSMGRGCVFEGWVDIPQRNGKIHLGNAVRICRYVELSVPKGGVLEIGDRVLLSRGVLISAHQRVVLGKFTMLAEYVVMHDNNHEFRDQKMPIQNQGMVSEDLLIGQDCWLGAHVTVLKGARLGAGCVAAAGAVVNKPFSDRQVLAGVPAKVIAER